MMNDTCKSKFFHKKPFECFAHYLIGKGHATLSSEINNGVVKVGIAFCYPGDEFNKAFGREIAAGRRKKSNHSFSFSFKCDDNRISDQIRSQFENFVISSTHEHPTAPGWAVYSLRRQLKREERKQREKFLSITNFGI